MKYTFKVRITFYKTRNKVRETESISTIIAITMTARTAIAVIVIT